MNNPICRISFAMLAVACVGGLFHSRAQAAAVQSPGTCAQLRPGTELFADDSNISNRANVIRRTHPCVKLAAPVLKGDEPWENGRVYIYGTVARDPENGGFRMWYTAPDLMAYATSKDGVTWTKPRFPIYRHDGAETNVLVAKANGASVLVDVMEADASKRYKALLANPIRQGGFRIYYSADGIHWNEAPDSRGIPFGSEMGNLIRDPKTGLYHAYLRPFPPRHHPKKLEEKRLGSVTTSRDLKHWSKQKIILTPDTVDDAWCRTPEQRTEFYAMNGFAYGNSYMGVIPLFRITRILDTIGKGQSKYDGPMEGQLITSRDGLEWSRMEARAPVIPSGTEFDVSIMNTATLPLIVGDEIWMYYTGINTTHGGPMPPKKISICLAKWRLDGFVSLDAAGDEGVIVTKPFRTGNAGALELNIDARKGSASVEVLDENGSVVPGYGHEDCAAISGDSVRARVKWNTRETLPPETLCMLRIRMKNASIYSYTISGPKPESL